MKRDFLKIILIVALILLDCSNSNSDGSIILGKFPKPPVKYIWHPGGKWIVADIIFSKKDIHAVRYNISAKGSMERDANTAWEKYFNISWFPDGRRFVANTLTKKGAQIVISSIENLDSEEFLEGTSIGDINPSVSKDGIKIAYNKKVGRKRETNLSGKDTTLKYSYEFFAYYILDIKDIQKGQVIDFPNIHSNNFLSSIEWLPGDTEIVLVKYSYKNRDAKTSMQIVKVNLIHKDIYPLIKEKKYSSFCPSVSHNGKYLAYISDKTGIPQVWVMCLVTKENIQVTFSKAPKYCPQWQPRTDRISFISVEKGILHKTFYLKSIRNPFSLRTKEKFK